MSRADRHKEAARKVEERLREEGRAFDADQIRHLRLSLSAFQTTLSQVHKQLGEALTALRAEREKALREAAAVAYACGPLDEKDILALIPKDGEKP